MRTLVLMVGLPGSGKSTYADRDAFFYESMEQRKTAIISRDFIRKQMVKPGEDYFSCERAVFRKFVEEINSSMEAGVDITYADATHISKQSRRKLLRALDLPGSEVCLEVAVVNTDIDECKRRNSLRTGFEHVPDTAIDRMAASFEIPIEEEFKEYDFHNVKVRMVKV